MKTALTLLLALLAGGALADDGNARRSAEREHVQTLLLAQPSADAQCGQQAGNQAELKACLARLLLQGEQDRLNAEAAALAAMKQLDRVLQRQHATPALQKDIKAYAAYRKAHCAWVAASYGSGAGAGIAEAACLIDLDRARAHTFSIYYMR
ncbi:lysozyme inhibitor LprI family protein [Chitinilyticum litopenaei]|uniref:lysozyme inhibitor LprI family protein n=1 Tax=Chitinilyticum litopenaei TaxID=1121276 RepID=UPI00040F9221|nr:lysozyme inhibitor LprI family protein [Chitinilyticum litopenaei]